MKVLRGPPADWERPAKGTVVTTGVYDGVHLGHQAVLRRAQKRAEGRPHVVLTFAQHPAVVLAPDRAPRILTTLRQKVAVLGGLGVDVVAFLEFDEETRLMSAADFVRRLVVGALRAEVVVVGQDFRFGHNREGDVALLDELGPMHGYTVEAIPLEGGDHPISSTDIRRHLVAGDLETASRLLGRFYEVEGEVVAGDGRGKSIGVPTANLDLQSRQLVPRHGVYAVMAKVRGAWLPAVANVGVRPTFGGEQEVVEVHLLSFSDDLYGEVVAVQFRSRIRDERKFDGVEELVAQIRTDIGAASEFLGVAQRTTD